MEDKLEKFKRTEEDKILTKTMINNYTKNEIIPSPKKKKYSKEHMMLLILTYHMKQTLSMGDIHSLLSPISENDDVETLYKNFLEIQLKEYNEFPKEILKKVDELETQISSHEDESNHLMIYSIIFFLIIQASMQKKLAETLIDNFFIDKKSDKS
jgi:DNA-binding transcriptional MerR regulator